MEKKGSDHFRDILNPYGEKINYGKIGRRRRLSKLSFFSIILSVTVRWNYVCMYECMYVCMYVCVCICICICNEYEYSAS